LRGISSFYGSHRVSLTLRFGLKAPEEELEAELRRTQAELESAKEAAQKARLEAEEMIMKAKEISDRDVREAQERQRQTEDTLHRLEEELRGINEKLQAEKETKGKATKRYWGKGFGYYQKGEYEKAIAEFEKILELEPTHPQSKRLIKQAKEKLQQKIQVEEVEKHYTQGLKAYHAGRLEEAIKELEIALKLDPKNEEIRILLERTKKEIQLK
jgi:tetratricopeptide (TPR) repeat protein